MKIKESIELENEYVKSILYGGKPIVDSIAKNEGITNKLVRERFRNQRKNKISLNTLTTKEDAIEVINFFSGDAYKIATYFNAILGVTKKHLAGLLVSKDYFMELYIEKELSYADMVKKVGYPTIVTVEYLKNINTSTYKFIKSTHSQMKGLREKYQNNKEKLLEAQKKREKTNIKRYGVPIPLKNDKSILKLKATNTERYGTDNVIRVKRFRRKQRETTMKRYGGYNYTDSELVRAESIKEVFTPTSYVYSPNEVITLVKGNHSGKMSDKLTQLVNKYLKDNKKSKITLLELSDKILGVPYSYLNGLKENSIRVDENSSLYTSRRGMESELGDYLSTFNYKVLTNKLYKELDNKQLDFYIPELKIAFEFNGSYYHATLGTTRGVSGNYHLEKTIKARENMGVTIFHVWESDWLDPIRKKIVKSQIAYKMHDKKIVKIPARKTEVRVITAKQAEDFFSNNHIQGGQGTAGKERFGLFYENRLVAAMTFGKRYTGTHYWELLRFANEINTTVVGGASKLLSYFEKGHKGQPIMSYANNDFGFSSAKSMYTKLGFSYIKTTVPGYHWVNSKDNTVINRQKVMPKNLLLFTENKRKPPFIGATKDFRVINPNETENEYMLRNGYLKVFNAGNDLYEKK